jgi:hypothetical protein
MITDLVNSREVLDDVIGAASQLSHRKPLPVG